MNIYQNSLFSATTCKVGEIKKPSKIAKDMLKKCCKCGAESTNTIIYSANEIMCMDCYCELIAKRER